MNNIVKFIDGYVIHGDSTDTEVLETVRAIAPDLTLIIADPPYGDIVNEAWDKIKGSDIDFAQWMIGWTRDWSALLKPGGAFYVWGGIGRPKFRPFFHYMANIEKETDLEIANLITWKKKRGYGVQNNYLFTREECAYLTKGSAKKPAVFNIPLLEEKRGYAGYDENYPAKSEFYRRTNVWTDITEILKGKLHPTQKQQRLHEVMIEVHTNAGDWVVDPFAGAGTTALAARKLGRRFVVVEQDIEHFETILRSLQ